MRTMLIAATAVLWAGLGPAGPAWGVSPARFAESSPADYVQGVGENVVWDEEGRLRLGRALASVVAGQEGLNFVAALAVGPKDEVYAVTGTEGRIYKVTGTRAELFTTLEDKLLFSAAVDSRGNLFVGSGGENGRIWKITPDGQASQFYKSADALYYWGLAFGPKGDLLAATGPNGKLLAISPAAKAEERFATKQKHLRSLLVTADGTAYVGTDGDAVVYRIDPASKAFALYDAPEPEVTAIAADAAGNIYFCTATAGAAGRPGPTGPSADGSIGLRMLTFGNFIPQSAEPRPAPPKKPEEKAPPSESPQEKGPDASSAGGGVHTERLSRTSGRAAPGGDGPAEIDDVHTGVLMDDRPTHLSFWLDEKAAPNDAKPLDNGPEEPRPQPPAAPPVPVPPTPQPKPAPKPKEVSAGNAIYRISPDGFVRRLYSTSEGMLLALAVDGDQLLVGSAVHGQMLAYDLKRDKVAGLAKVESAQVLSLARTSKGRVLVGVANPGGVYVLEPGLAARGSYTSRVYDAGMSAKWGRLHVELDAPRKSRVTVATRTGNVSETDDKTWSEWSQEASEDAPVASPAARYIQYRLTLATGDADVTPVVKKTELVYLQANQAPTVVSVGIATPPPAPPGVKRPEAKPAGGPPGPNPAAGLALTWKAEDPNGDALSYSLYFRMVGREPWILLAEDVAEPKYQWHTRGIADGWYEVRVVASDAPANPHGSQMAGEKTSDPVLIDNVAPVVKGLEAKIEKDGVRLTATLQDDLGDLVAARFAVDSASDWKVLMPADGIFDSKVEKLDALVPLPEPGEHQLAVQVEDQAGNVGTATVFLTVKK